MNGKLNWEIIFTMINYGLLFCFGHVVLVDIVNGRLSEMLLAEQILHKLRDDFFHSCGCSVMKQGNV